MTIIPIILIIIALLMASAFLSGTETGVYRLSRFRLKLGLQQRHKLYGLLDKLMADSRGLIFSILIANNVVNYILTSLVTYIFLSKNTTQLNAEFYATVITVPLLFVFGDLLPKNIFFYRADLLMPLIATPVYVIHRIFTITGAVPLLKLFSRVFLKLAGASAATPQLASAAQRQHIRQIVSETREEGVLSSVQADIIERLMRIPQVPISAVMVPLANIVMTQTSSSRSRIIELLKKEGYRRILIQGTSPAEILGYVDTYELLSDYADFDSIPLSAIKHITTASASASVLEILTKMRNDRIDIMLVTRQDIFGRTTPIGIVTINDLLEELVGELAQT